MSQERRRPPTPAEIDLINAMFEALITGKATRDSGDLVIQAKLSDEHYAALHSFDAYSLMSSGRDTPIVAEATSGGWIEWSGGECPLPDHAKFNVQLRCDAVRDEDTVMSDPLSWVWWDRANPGDIIAYRVVPA
ncbi:hypothetical protein ABIA16_003819 [Sinorhizobium fredii]